MNATPSSTNRSILITGCSRGIGRVTALYLARHGYTVFAGVRKEADRQSLLAEGEPNLVPLCPLDLTRPEDFPGAVAAVEAELARRGQTGLYALMNNAGGGQVAPIEMMDLGIFNRELQARISGPVALIQAFLPLLRQAKGRLLWIMTPAAIPTPYVASIHACDFAVNCLVRTLAIELAPWNIPCIQIRCGGIDTESSHTEEQGLEPLLRQPRGELYRAALTRWAGDIGQFDQKRTAPVEVAKVVRRALNAEKPRQRYAIGHMAGLAGFLEDLPQAVGDAVLRKRFE